MSGPESRPLVVWCAGVHWDALRGTDRHLVTALSEHVDVLWVDPPLSVVRRFRHRSHGQRSHGRGLSQVAPSVHRLTVLAPPLSTRPVSRHLATAFTRVMIRVALRRMGSSSQAILAQVVSWPELLFVVGPDRLKVYFATDDFAAGSSLLGLPQTRLLRVERRLASQADLLVGVSSAIVDRWAGGSAERLVLPNGCALPDDVSPTDPLELGIELEPPIAIVVGQFTPRIDLGLLEAVAERQVSLLLVGPHHPGFLPDRFEALVNSPNVAWVGQQPFEAVARCLKVSHVGLTPYSDSEFNRASFPLKTLEYLAAGRAVVSTPLPAVRTLGTEHVDEAADPVGFADAVQRRLAEPLTTTSLEQRRAFARRHTWEARAKTLLDTINGTARSLRGEQRLRPRMAVGRLTRVWR